jgi:hypothetical protein
MSIGRRVGAALAVTTSLAAVAFAAAPAGANQRYREYARFNTQTECIIAIPSYPANAAGCAQFGTPYWILWGPWEAE